LFDKVYALGDSFEGIKKRYMLDGLPVTPFAAMIDTCFHPVFF